MGLTNKATGLAVISQEFKVNKKSEDDIVIAVAGNPNVGKSTLFNALTGMNQHTGNWPGKTVSNARGSCKYKGKNFVFVDLPGTYSLMSNSTEEEIARDFVCFGEPDLVVVVVDATCLERNLNLALQILEITKNVIVCVNLMDEARKKKIIIDLDELSLQLGVPVIGTSARSKSGLEDLKNEIYELAVNKKKTYGTNIEYNEKIEKAISKLKPIVESLIDNKLNSRWLSIKLLDMNVKLHRTLNKFLLFDIMENQEIKQTLKEINREFFVGGFNLDLLRDEIVSNIIQKAQRVYEISVKLQDKKYTQLDRKIDKLLTSKLTGIPIMILLLFVVFWITITGANYPSDLIADGLFFLQDKLVELFETIGVPQWLNDVVVLGIYRTLAWVVSVMLPPMAIFFPLFTLLEDSGYLPRIAFNLDKFFKKASAHGKQALTMCMGFGCNACGIIGCRIIDSPRERLIAILTNNFVPCNGRFPTLIAIISMFFAGVIALPYRSFVSTLLLTGTIIIGVFMTFLTSKFLSKTILKGMPSSFILELPPYRRPQIGKVIIRSIFDRTLFVLGRAVLVAAPAGLLIWLMSNIFIGEMSVLSYCSNFLDPFARLIGMDGIILMAFILGFPANEIVMPIIIMSYLCTGTLTNFESLEELHLLLVNNGWTWLTAVCTMLFSLMHFPCGTTCLTIKKETGSLKWTAVSFLLPTIIGILTCFLVASFARILNLV
ncbi:ferrous iron transport protein B [Clostridium sp. CAG:557]|nr:ferrous iron transport protein B [Clostridium sp. CAG:557]